MLRTYAVRHAATFWGFAVFMPVGVNYAAMLLLLIAMLATPARRERAARVRAHPLWWFIVAYLAWTLLVLAFGAHYKETGSNLWHGIRIALTMLMALALARDEAVWALRGFLAAAVLSLVIVLLSFTVGLPPLQIWHSLTIMDGNKAINNALLFSLVGTTCAVVGLAHLGDARRWHWAGPALTVTVVMAIVVTFMLINRTSLLGMLVAIMAACVHQWRGRLRALAVAVCAVAALASVLIWQAPAVQHKFELGMQEIEAAQAGAVSEGSWIVRYYMYRDTGAMIADKPLAGWGIGGWTSQWHLRGPKLLANYNMPHNDFLWMGAQAGIPGLLSLLAIVLAGVWVAWRRPDLTGRIGFAGMLTLLVATSANSSMRDAQIGLSLLWIAFVYLRMVGEAGSPWREVLPARVGGAFSGGGPPAHPL